MTDSGNISTLRELIAALDRRRPRGGHPAEAGIAKEAAALKSRAIEQLEALELEGEGDGLP